MSSPHLGSEYLLASSLPVPPLAVFLFAVRGGLLRGLLCLFRVPRGGPLPRGGGPRVHLLCAQEQGLCGAGRPDLRLPHLLRPGPGRAVPDRRPRHRLRGPGSLHRLPLQLLHHPPILQAPLEGYHGPPPDHRWRGTLLAGHLEQCVVLFFLSSSLMPFFRVWSSFFVLFSSLSPPPSSSRRGRFGGNAALLA